MSMPFSRAQFQMRTIPLALSLSICLYASQAQATPDLFEMIPHVYALRRLAGTIAGGAASGVREEMQGFLQQEVDPILGRIDLILRDNVRSTFANAQELLQLAEQALTRIIHQSLVGAREILRGAGQLVGQVDETIQQAICRVSPYGDGIQVYFNLPFAPPPDRRDSVTVLEPVNNPCFRSMLRTTSEFQRTFTGHEYYRGMLCMNEMDAWFIDPASPDASARLESVYIRLELLSIEAFCSWPPSARGELMSRRSRYRDRSNLLRSVQSDPGTYTSNIFWR